MADEDSCMWCGAKARQEKDEYGEYVIAACGTTHFGTQRTLMRSTRCELRETQNRIDDAIIRAGQATVFGFEPHSSVRCVFASNLVEVVEILRGNAPTGWTQGIACRDLGEQLRTQHEHAIEILRGRIDAAVKALQYMTRHEIEPDDQFGIVDERSEHGEWVKWVDVEDVIEFLTGNTPTNPEGSP